VCPGGQVRWGVAPRAPVQGMTRIAVAHVERLQAVGSFWLEREAAM
jgi:hypothetical protein